MPLVLGIDTGGIFTDGVLLDIGTKEVKRKAKALKLMEIYIKYFRSSQ